MKSNLRRGALIAAAAVATLAGCSTISSMVSSGPPTTFFITSVNPGRGGDLGGLAGADAHCERLAAAAGAGGRDWRAYLSTQPTSVSVSVDARDRIGSGPWMNSKGVVVARNLAELHGANNINKETALSEAGAVIPATGDPVNKHDILTGSRPDGTAIPGERDATCGNWSSSDAGGAMVGHHNRGGINPDPVANISWNSSHVTPGCSMQALARVGGAGLMYCFAAK